MGGRRFPSSRRGLDDLELGESSGARALQFRRPRNLRGMGEQATRSVVKLCHGSFDIAQGDKYPVFGLVRRVVVGGQDPHRLISGQSPPCGFPSFLWELAVAILKCLLGDISADSIIVM